LFPGAASWFQIQHGTQGIDGKESKKPPSIAPAEIAFIIKVRLIARGLCLLRWPGNRGRPSEDPRVSH
jgi:hypothetical protein